MTKRPAKVQLSRKNIFEISHMQNLFSSNLFSSIYEAFSIETPEEKLLLKLAGELLKNYGDDLSNNGCNDPTDEVNEIIEVK
mgnify:CR=1 FL=1